MATRKRKAPATTPLEQTGGLHDLINEYRERLLAERWDEGDTLPDHPVIDEVAEGLLGLLDQIIAAKKYDDDWIIDPEARYLGYGHYVAFAAEKLDAQYFFGFHLRSGFFIGTVLRYPEQLQSMPDAYWGRLSRLAELGTTSYGRFLQLATMAGQDSRRTQTANSTIFRIIRDVALASGAKSRKDSIPGPDSLDVSLPLTVDAVTLVTTGGEILRMLYEVNYDLYRVASQRHKRRRKQ